jgi:MFS family permease
MAAAQERRGPEWLTPGVRGIGAASLLSDLGHEVPTALLPAFLTTTLGAPASALGLIEGISDGLSGAAKLAGGALADDPERRRRVAVGGYGAAAVFSASIGFAGAAWQVGALRAAAWSARGLRSPSRNALLTDAVDRSAYGRAFGFERAMDNLGAIGGPLLALALVALVGTRQAILLSVVPGLLAMLAMIYAIRHMARFEARERKPIRLQIRGVVRGRLAWAFGSIGAFELGNMAATLMILRATELLEPGHGHDRAVEIALVLYTAYNASATLSSIPAGRLGDRSGQLRVLALGIAAFAFAYGALAVSDDSIALLGACFVAAGVAIGCVETAEHAAVATFAPAEVRGSAFGLLAALQSAGNLAASGIAGLLWTTVSPRAAFGYAAGCMVLALIGLAFARRRLTSS